MINYNRLAYELKRNISKFSNKISVGLKRPKMKFLTQMIYGLLEGNKTHLSEIARSLKESITLKKTIECLSRNLHNFDNGKAVMDNYINLAKQNIKLVKTKVGIQSFIPKNLKSQQFDIFKYFKLAVS